MRYIASDRAAVLVLDMAAYSDLVTTASCTSYGANLITTCVARAASAATASRSTP